MYENENIYKTCVCGNGHSTDDYNPVSEKPNRRDSKGESTEEFGNPYTYIFQWR